MSDPQAAADTAVSVNERAAFQSISNAPARGNRISDSHRSTITANGASPVMRESAVRTDGSEPAHGVRPPKTIDPLTFYGAIHILPQTLYGTAHASRFGRFAPGHARFARTQDAELGTDPRLRSRAVDPADHRRRAVH